MTELWQFHFAIENNCQMRKSREKHSDPYKCRIAQQRRRPLNVERHPSRRGGLSTSCGLFALQNLIALL